MTRLVELKVGPQTRYPRLSKAILTRRELPREDMLLNCRTSPVYSAKHLIGPECRDLSSQRVTYQKNKIRVV